MSVSYSSNVKSIADQLWDAIERLAHEDGTADRIRPAIIAKLIELKIAQLSGGLPQLTPYGMKCYIVMGSGEGVVPDLNDMGERGQSRQRTE